MVKAMQTLKTEEDQLERHKKVASVTRRCDIRVETCDRRASRVLNSSL